MRDTVLNEAVGPVAHGCGRDAEGGFFGQPVAVASRCGMLPREEGEDRAGMALLVAVVEVVRAGVVEIDGLLDEAEPEDARVKLQVSGCAPGDGGDVMDAGHGELLSGGRIARSCADDRRHRSSVMWSWLPSMTMRSKRPSFNMLGTFGIGSTLVRPCSLIGSALLWCDADGTT